LGISRAHALWARAGGMMRHETRDMGLGIGSSGETRIPGPEFRVGACPLAALEVNFERR
jgi:hypothetical protein